MKHCTAYAATVLLAGSALGDQTGCSTASWYNHKSELSCIPPLELDAQSTLISVLKNQYSNIDIGNIYQQPTNTFSRDGYSYNFGISTNGVRVSGIDKVSVQLTDATSALGLKGVATLEGTLEVDVDLTATITQNSAGFCRDDEEEYLGLCYKRCADMNPSHPLRTATNTCSRNGCDANQEENAGLCYTRCAPGYTGVLTVCWKNCPDGYTDMGLYCYKWWLPSFASKDPYDRGVGRLPYEPDTWGFGCNGYGVGADGGCAKIRSKHCYGQLASQYSFWNIFWVQDHGCPAIQMKLSGKLTIPNPKIDFEGEIAIMACNNPIDETNPACNRARPGDFLGQFINSPWDSTKQSIFDRVTDVRVTSVTFDDLNRADFSIELTDGGGAPQNWVDYAKSQVGNLVNKDKFLGVMKNRFQKNFLDAAKQAINANLPPYYGKTCPDCELCAVEPVPGNGRCNATRRLESENEPRFLAENSLTRNIASVLEK